MGGVSGVQEKPRRVECRRGTEGRQELIAEMLNYPNLFSESPKNALSCCAGSINGVRFFIEICSSWYDRLGDENRNSNTNFKLPMAMGANAWLVVRVKPCTATLALGLGGA